MMFLVFMVRFPLLHVYAESNRQESVVPRWQDGFIIFYPNLLNQKA